MKKQRGFTLMEVMVVVVIISILASIAYPSYMDYMIRSRIPEATSALAAKRVQMEQFFQDNRSYLKSDGNPPPICDADSQNNSSFTASCVAGSVTATTYTLQAVGNAGGVMDGFTYTINQSNTKVTNIARSGWHNPNPNNCWAIRKNGECS